VLASSACKLRILHGTVNEGTFMQLWDFRRRDFTLETRLQYVTILILNLASITRMRTVCFSTLGFRV